MMGSLHFRKGCFVGNEIVNKQVAMNTVRRRLVGLCVAVDSASAINRGGDASMRIVREERETRRRWWDLCALGRELCCPAQCGT
jgi:folate-binding Fe-S cluster repair protein YgfZ